MTWKLNIRRESVRPDLTVLQVDGRLGSASSGALIEAIVRVIEAGDRQLVVDLGERRLHQQCRIARTRRRGRTNARRWRDADPVRPD